MGSVASRTRGRLASAAMAGAAVSLMVAGPGPGVQAEVPGPETLKRTEIRWGTHSDALRVLTVEGRQHGERLGSGMATWPSRLDGFPGVLISAPSFDSSMSDAGRLIRIRIPSFAEAGIADIPFRGLIPEGKQGHSVSGVGDFDGDGVAEIALGAPYHGGRRLRTGAVGILSLGPLGWAPAAPSIEFGVERANFGHALDAVGDVNRDGYGDLVVGAPTMSRNWEEEGAVFLYLGSPEGLAPQAVWQAWGGKRGIRLGENVRAAGDVNGDGFDDVLVAAPRSDGALPAHGEVRLYLGCPVGLEASPAWTHGADRPYSVMGRGMGRAGDLNHDGLADVCIGLPGLPDGQHPRGGGSVCIFFGQREGLSATPDIVWEGPIERDGFGGAICLVGDMNGDGWPELAVGAPFTPTVGKEHGVVRVFPGTFAGFSTTPVLQITGGLPGGRYGFVLTALGDLDGDGLADLGVGSPHFQARNHANGRCDVVFGSRALGGPTAFLEALREPALILQGGNMTLAAVSEWRRPPPEIRHVHTHQAVEATVVSRGDRVLLGILAATAALLWLAWRSARAKIETIRNRLHDFVGSELAGMKHEDPGLRRVLEELRVTIWATKQERPTVGGLVVHLADWSSRFSSERGLALRLELPPGPMDDARMDPIVAETAHAAVRVALSNVVEHARASLAVLRVKVDGRQLEVEVEDNGAGIASVARVLDPDRSQASGSHGLSALRRRVEWLEGAFGLQSSPGAGTRLTIRLPVRAAVRARRQGSGATPVAWSAPREPSSSGST